MLKKVKGSLTIFFSLVMVSVMTLIFTMAECIRLYELHDFASEYTDMAVESAFSEYNPFLWKNYRILALDLGYGSDSVGTSILEQKIMDYCRYNSNIDYGFNYARLMPNQCVTNSYCLLTDKSGQGVVMLGTKAAKDGMATQIIDTVQNNINDVNAIEKVSVVEKAKNGKDALDDAKTKLNNDKQAAADDDDPNTNPEDYPSPGEVEDNPLDAFGVVKEAISNGILSTVIEADTIPDNRIDINNLPSHRSLIEGTNEMIATDSIANKALFIDYLLTTYSYYGMDKQHGGMSYELEYLISGKETDAQCLAAVVEELLLIRESANYATILLNPSLLAQAAAIAEVLAGFTMNPVIIEAVKYAIVAAWAYIESTLDIRLLLSGGKVALVKGLDEWTSDVWHLSSFLNVNSKAKESSLGIGYKEYLIGFLAAKSIDTLGIRACDVMETALHSTDDYKNTRCDNLVYAADIEMGFYGNEMFLSIFKQDNTIDGYELKKVKSISY